MWTRLTDCYYTCRPEPLNFGPAGRATTLNISQHRILPGSKNTIAQPIVIPPSEHGISDADISGGALKVLETLTDAGHGAYLVGGGVRDLLLDLKPKDFDVATAATPETVRSLFRSCRLIGRRFRLAHVRMGREIIEVATFRAGSDTSAGDPDHVRVDGRIVRDNVYGTLEEDAWRRDFTANCLYYDHRERTVIDFTGGYADVRERRLRVIGCAAERYREDPVRMLRAVRFAGKLGFDIDSDTSDAIHELAPLIEDMPPARLYEEVFKLFMAGAARANYELLRRYGLFGHLFPETEACIEAEPDGIAAALAGRALDSTDTRIASGRPVTPGFLFAALLWEPVLRDSEACIARGMPHLRALDAAGADVIERQIQHVSLPAAVLADGARDLGTAAAAGEPARPRRREPAAGPSEVQGRLRLPAAAGGVGRGRRGARPLVDPDPGGGRRRTALDAGGSAHAETPPPAPPGARRGAPGAHRTARDVSAPHSCSVGVGRNRRKLAQVGLASFRRSD